jgi:hypothetical protein
LSIHCAVQSACVCALRGAHTTSLPILSRESQKVYSAWINGTRESFGKEKLKLASFPELYKRVRNQSVLRNPHTLPSFKNRDLDIDILNEVIRNTFQHFGDDSLSLEISGLPRIARSACEIVEHLAITHRTMNFRLTSEQHKSIVESLGVVRQRMATVDNETSSSSNA